MMLNRLRQPKGAVGILSVVATLVLALWGVFVIVAMLILDDEEMTQGDEVLVAVLGALMIVGAVGFVIMDRQPGLGAALAILGSIALAIVVFWTIVPIILGIVFIIVAVMRAQALAGHTAHS
jgi:drug/metabolite transporter (DMT)-like permease